MATFQAQGWGEDGLVLTPIRELPESPFYPVPQNRTPGSCWERTWVFGGSLSLRNWSKSRQWSLGEGRTAASGRKRGHQNCCSGKDRDGKQISRKLPCHSADTHGGPVKSPMGDPEAAEARSLVSWRPQTDRRD